MEQATQDMLHRAGLTRRPERPCAAAEQVVERARAHRNYFRTKDQEIW